MKNDPVEQSRHGIEVWKPCAGYEGIYEVSNLGKIWSVRRQSYHPTNKSVSTIRGKFIKGWISAEGYPQVKLRDISGVFTTWPRHRIIYLTFVGPADLVRHLDDVKTNCKLYNLAEGTHTDNMRDRIRNGNRTGMAKLTDEQVNEIRGMLNAGYKDREIAPDFGVSHSTIGNIRKRKFYNTRMGEL